MADFIGAIYYREKTSLLNPLIWQNKYKNWEKYFENQLFGIFVPPGLQFRLSKFENDFCTCFVSGNVFVENETALSIRQNIRCNVGVPDEYLLPYYFSESRDISFESLRGDFNILLYNKRNQSVSIITSRFGMIPLYYYHGNGFLIVSSKILHMTNTGLVPNKTDEISWLEHFVFNHFPGDYTGITNVRLFPPASICMVKKDTPIHIKKYWEAESLLHQSKPIKKHDGLVLLDETIRAILKRMLSRTKKPAVTLTGGWDGRLVLSYMLALEADFFLYSFGAENSADIDIPRKISADLGLLYVPVILNDEYLQNHFLDCARRTILESDGMRSFTRAHYIYGIENIGKSTKYLFSGNCGSNILKTSKRVNQIINADLLQLIFDGKVTPKLISGIIDILKFYPFTEVSMLQIEELLSRLEGYNVCRQQQLTANQRYYIFLLEEIERKYFGIETQTYQNFVTNFSFYIDYEFLTVLAQTVFFGVNLPFYHNDVRYKYLSTWLYANLIKKNYPALAVYTSDKGFSLEEALNPIGKLKALYQKYSRKNVKRNANSDTYNTNPTIAIFRDHLISRKILDKELNGRMMKLDKKKQADCLSWLYWNAQLQEP